MPTDRSRTDPANLVHGFRFLAPFTPAIPTQWAFFWDNYPDMREANMIGADKSTRRRFYPSAEGKREGLDSGVGGQELPVAASVPAV